MKFNGTQNFQALKGHKGSIKLIHTAQPQTAFWSDFGHVMHKNQVTK